jgi:hypothetical protein
MACLSLSRLCTPPLGWLLFHSLSGLVVEEDIVVEDNQEDIVVEDIPVVAFLEEDILVVAFLVVDILVVAFPVVAYLEEEILIVVEKDSVAFQVVAARDLVD